MVTLTRKQLLSLPERPWNTDTGDYDSLLLVPGRKMHDSGWMVIAIVGVRNDKAIEIAATPDAIDWNGDMRLVKTDCTYPTGILHFWARYARFHVGTACSSVDITIVPKEK